MDVNDNHDAFLGLIKNDIALSDLNEADATAIYKELRLLADMCFRSQAAGHTLQPTALVNEAVANMIRSDSKQWESKSHFLGTAAKAMRHILIDHARKKRAQKRGGDLKRVTLSGAVITNTKTEYDALDIDEALVKLDKVDPRQARVVELKFFGGLSTFQISEVLGVSPRTVELDWRFARAWLRRELAGIQDEE